jgi:hypothetical protein
MPARSALWVLVATAVLATFTPMRSLNCPSWDVWVTDEGGHPVSYITVRLTYRDYSAEFESHEIDAITDVRGHAAFRARTLTASLGRRVAAMALSASAGPHASFGPHAIVFAFGKGLQGVDIGGQGNTVADWTGKPGHVESRIVATPQKTRAGCAGYGSVGRSPSSEVRGLIASCPKTVV